MNVKEWKWSGHIYLEYSKDCGESGSGVRWGSGRDCYGDRRKHWIVWL